VLRHRVFWALVVALTAALLASCGAPVVERREEPKPLPVPAPDEGHQATQQKVEAVEDRVRAAVREALGRDARRIEADRSIDAACRATSRIIADGGDAEMVPAHLRHALHGEQIVDAAYLPFTFEIAEGGPVPQGLLDLVASETTGRHMSHMGVGAAASPGGVVVTVVLVRRMVALSAFPRRVTAGSSQVLWGQLTSPLVQRPRVVLATPRGAISDLLVRTQGVKFMVSVPFTEGEGRYVLQVLAEDAYGPQVASQLEVDAGDEPSLPTVRVMPAAPPLRGEGREPLEEQMVALVNDYREAMGLSRLLPDPRLTASARHHSADMRDQRYFGHRSPVRGELPERLRKADVPPALVLENIAMSVTIPWAHDRLVDSPSHRRNLLDPRVTHIGVGVVTREAGPVRIVYVTEHLARLEGR
jgi:uncharacterized protein YkwD